MTLHTLPTGTHRRTSLKRADVVLQRVAGGYEGAGYFFADPVFCVVTRQGENEVRLCVFDLELVEMAEALRIEGLDG